MSSFFDVARNPKTNRTERAAFIDDYFGKHQYGVFFEDNPKAYRPDDVSIQRNDTGKSMSYNYEKEKLKLFTDDGQRMFIEMRDKAFRLLDISGAVRMNKIMTSGDTFTMMACADRMIEIGDLVEITGPEVWGQDRVFVKKTS